MHTSSGDEVVPAGQYGWIDGYDHGLARVRTAKVDGHAKWGIIDENGNEVLPCEYDEVWNFLGKGRSTTTVVKDGDRDTFDLDAQCLESEEDNGTDYYIEPEYDDYYRQSYGEYAGSYAQDWAGLSDEVIDDAFDGDPDAYWNID